MRSFTVTLLCILVVIFSAAGAENADSVVTYAPRGERLFPTAPVVTGLGLTGVSLISRYSYPHDGFTRPNAYERTSRGTDALQFVPMAFPWVVKAFGVPTRSSWKQLAINNAAAVALTGALTYSLKSAISSPRPDGTDNRSFPSGHAAWAFAGATIMERELGWCSEWYTIGAYAFATGVALERVIDQHHYPTDVFAGAGIGILATHLGYFVGDMIMGKKDIQEAGREVNSDNLNLSYFSLETGMLLPLGPVDFGDGVKLIRLPAISGGLKGGFAIEDNWGISVEGGVQSTPLLIDVRHDRTNVANLTGAVLVVSPYYRLALSQRLSFTGDVGFGYIKHFNINSIDKAVRGNSGTIVGRVNIGAIMRFSDHFSLKASAGFQLSGYRFTIDPSEAYHTTVYATKSGLTPALLFNLSSRYEF